VPGTSAQKKGLHMHPNLTEAQLVVVVHAEQVVAGFGAQQPVPPLTHVLQLLRLCVQLPGHGGAPQFLTTGPFPTGTHFSVGPNAETEHRLTM
jgi:hypothetical protein